MPLRQVRHDALRAQGRPGLFRDGPSRRADLRRLRTLAEISRRAASGRLGENRCRLQAPAWNDLMSFTCPRCGATSHHQMDEDYGYCAMCHAFTGTPKEAIKIEPHIYSPDHQAM